MSWKACPWCQVFFGIGVGQPEQARAAAVAVLSLMQPALAGKAQA